MTTCHGAVTKAEVPIASARAMVPKNLVVKEQTPGFSSYFLQSIQCEKVAVDGVDGNRSFKLTFGLFFVEKPAGYAIPSDNYLAYLCEAFTDQETLAEVLRRAGVGISSGAFSLQHKDVPGGTEEVTTTIQNGSSVAYESTMYPNEGRRAWVEKTRILYEAKDLEKYVFSDQSGEDSSGDGQSVLRTRDGAALASSGSPLDVYSGSGSRIHSSSAIWTVQG